MKIIFAGKGGSGKTTVVGLFLLHLLKTEPNAKVLVIDADPSANLSLTLNIDTDGLESIGSYDKVLQQQKAYSIDLDIPILLNNIVKEVNIANYKVDYSYMGHHERNSCLCSYNGGLNSLLKRKEILDKYDFIILDREAGVEHINRSVYGTENDSLIIVTWPTNEYLQIASDINKLADMLGTTKKRVLVINNSQDLVFSEQEIESALASNRLDSLSRVHIPKLNIFSGIKKKSTEELYSNLDNNTLKTLDILVNLITES